METKKILSAAAVILAAAGTLAWTLFNPSSLPEGVVETNGRLEAEQVEVATKTAGRVAEVLVSEGQLVAAGDLLVRMDNQQLLAKKRAQFTRELRRNAHRPVRLVRVEREIEALLREEVSL